ncbi:DUF2306 domain-containing protein [Pseudonocardia sp. TRM90224]|uniref:DUF2306 domain-containing protein n=1 Tax=Pseudonocardia sp. TRM90224 TaxID=2812678 RepID=UPI001E5E8659|nr:DUF2306 domain-containing protein [Pseudonocardia sp. TRM90224]
MSERRSQPLLRPRKVWAMLALGVVVGSVAISPYVTLDMGSSRLAVTGALYYALLVGHIGTAMVALVLGPLQFVPAIRARRRVHKRIGRTYLFAGVVPSAVLAVPVAIMSGRLVTQVGLSIPAVLWLVTAWLAVRAIRRGDVEAHRSWMARNYALTFLAITARIIVPLLLVGQIATGSVTAGGAAAAASGLIPIGQVLGWVVNLAVAEAFIRLRRRAHAAQADRRRAARDVERREQGAPG